MYYPYSQNKRHQFLRSLAILLILTLSVVPFPKDVFAGLLDKTAQEYRAKGYEEQSRGNFKIALDYYSKALTLGVSNAPLMNDLGVIYEQLGLPEQAEGYYLKAVDLQADYLPPYTNLAYLYLDRGDQSRAVQFFKERLSRADEHDPWRDKILADLFRINPEYKKQIVEQKALALDKEIVEKAHEDFLLQVMRSQRHYQQGQEYLNTANYEQAMEEFDRALAITPDNPKILKAREQVVYEQRVSEVTRMAESALSDLEAGDLQSARKEFQHILTIIPSESAVKSEP